jgi:hypothetical protein
MKSGVLLRRSILRATFRSDFVMALGAKPGMWCGMADAQLQHQADPLGPRDAAAILMLIVLAELWIFSGAFDGFFTRDSLFYMNNIAHSWDQLKVLFLSPSQEMSYRPVNFAFMALLTPLLGTEPSTARCSEGNLQLLSARAQGRQVAKRQ